MKKLLLLVATVMAVTLLSAPMAYALPSPTEPDRQVEIEDPMTPLGEDPVGIEDPDVPLMEEPVGFEDPDVPLMEESVEIEDPDVPLGEDLVDIEDPDVPLAYVPAPQTGVTGLSGMEALTLAAMAFAVSGSVILAKARKQTGSVR